ncbi:MAG: hypothetical protein NXY57DRAFT_1037836 [Lentinula lateritia]|nr:MAG: hypothetical protein NXY57DRAFT_1037836 [Lentinula lateritia]
MSSSPEAQTISAFPPIRSAPLPRVVLLYNTSVTYSERIRTLSIHQNLPTKVRYHPYNPAKQSRENNSLPRVILPSGSLSNPTSIVPIVIPPPHSSMTVANSGWDVSTTKAYRKIAREAVKLLLDLRKPLGDQPLEIEEMFPELKAHEDHWGADTLLRDQLKSVRDTENKKK